MMGPKEQSLVIAVLVAHKALSTYEAAVRTTQSNIQTVSERLRECDPTGSLSEILRVGRQATVLTDCAKEAHDALAAVLEAANG